MPMRRAVAVLLLSGTAIASAEEADLSVHLPRVSERFVTDETFETRIVVANHGAAPAKDVLVSVTAPRPLFVRETAVPAGWTCDATPRFGASIACRVPRLDPGASGEISLRVATPEPGRLLLQAGVRSQTADSHTANDHSDMTVVIFPAAAHVDLAVSGRAAADPVPEGTTIDTIFDVFNDGRDEAQNVMLVLAMPGDDAGVLSASGEGWTCTQPAQRVVCTRPQLAPDAVATVVVRTTAPPRESVVTVAGQARAEAALETDPYIDSASYVTVGVGAAEHWERLLIPVTKRLTPGAGGSLWRTELAALFLADEQLEYRPHPCDFSGIPECIWPAHPMRRGFDGHAIVLEWDKGGQFLYVRKRDAAKLRINARIYDVARLDSTAGSEIPLPRQSEFASNVAMLNIPAAPQYRQTLRIYDDRGSAPTDVRVRMWQATGVPTLIDTVRTLTPSEFNLTTTTARLPTHPAYAQLDLGQLIREHEVGGVKEWNIEVQSLDENVKIWAFVSVTNNDTHHVTVVSPQ